MFVNTIITFSIVYVINYWKVTKLFYLCFTESCFQGRLPSLKTAQTAKLVAKLNPAQIRLLTPSSDRETQSTAAQTF